MSGCIRGQAKSLPDIPALDVPAPPARVVEATEQEPPPPVGLVDEPARAAPRPRPAPPPRTDAKPEPPKGDQAPVDAAAKPPEEPARPPATLQTAPAQREAEVERRVRGLLTQATADLSRIDLRRLDADAKLQYDTAKRFVNQAEDALRAKNLVFASNLADKAAALAAQLAGRR
jgi:hypothetical protein